MCGAATSETSAIGSAYGLSPRVRGSRLIRAADTLGQRSIPTCAGQPQPPRFHALKMWVYPHVCGAAPFMWRMQYMHTGLSPRVRGSRLGMPWRYLILRSIPTCAGQPCRASSGTERLRSIPTCAGQPLDELMLGTPTYPSGEYSNCISPDARRPRQRCSSALHPAS